MQTSLEMENFKDIKARSNEISTVHKWRSAKQIHEKAWSELEKEKP